MWTNFGWTDVAEWHSKDFSSSDFSTKKSGLNLKNWGDKVLVIFNDFW